MQKQPVTSNGFEQLKQELNDLVTVQRPWIITQIQEARAHGDLKENAEYHAAKEKQGQIEGRIQLLEHFLSQAQVVDITSQKNEGRVIFAATIHLTRLADKKTFSYQIVGEYEADISKNKISVKSPLSRALIGKHVHDMIEVDTPEGIVEYSIDAVDYV